MRTLAPAPITAPRIPLRGRLTPEQVAAHNAFIAEMAADKTGPDWVSQPSRFAGVQVGLPIHTTR